MPIITAWTVLVCGAFYLLQTVQVIRARRSAGVSLGTGGDALLERRMRGQANAAEQMPLTLLALLCAELLGATPWALAPLAALFVGARIAHGYAFGWMEHSGPLRMFGMAGTLTAAGGLLIVLLVSLLLRSFA